MTSRPKVVLGQKFLLGSILIVALVMGGGTTAGLSTDAALQVIVLLGFAVLVSGQAQTKGHGWLLAFGLAVVASMLVQLVPFPAPLLDGLRPPIVSTELGDIVGGREHAFISLGLARTLEASCFVIACVAFFWAIVRMETAQIAGLVPFFLLGVACNALASALQYSTANDVTLSGVFPYEVTAGFFANVNHFSALMFISIPLVAYYGIVAGRMKVALFSLAGILLLLLAAGSRAGVLIGFAIAILSLIFLSARGRLGVPILLAVFTGLVVFSMGAWTKVDLENLDPDSARAEMAKTTIDGIRDNWMLGIGYGNFQKGYQVYEKADAIMREYVNHAHNDFLEVIFEGGFVAATLIAAYIAMIMATLWSSRRDSLKKMAFLGIAFLLIHSLVDYPMRTMSLALSFAFLNAILFHSQSFRRRTVAEQTMMVELDGQNLAVPIEPYGAAR